VSGSPIVSVIIPSGRGGPFLREAVASVLTQTINRWELIVVADGPIGDLSDLHQIDDRVHVVQQDRQGVSTARNAGIAASRGQYLALLDDDDRMLPERLERQVAALDDDQGTGMAHAQVRIIDGAGQVLGDGIAHAVQYVDLLRGDMGFVTPSVTLRRSVLDRVGIFDPLLRAGEDLDLVLRVARASKLVFLPQVLVEYRRHGSNQYSHPRQFQRDIDTIYGRHLSVACRDGDGALAADIRRGIKFFRHYNAARSLDEAGSSLAAHRPLAAARSVAVAGALSPVTIWERARRSAHGRWR
jgi:glycosyltransferase involved in cell wall biosynthesis